MSHITRRGFLRASAVLGAGGIVAACGGGSTQGTGGQASVETTGGSVQRIPPGPGNLRYATPVTFKGKLKESPQLAELVKQGKLPPVEQRVPETPYVVPHQWVHQGKYGGVMRWVCADPTDATLTSEVQEAMYGHSPVRQLADGQELGPGLAESWESNADFTVWIYHFRKGLRWSDGVPFTVDDILFWWEDEVMDPALGLTPSQNFRSSKGTPVTMVKVDDQTLRLEYDSPSPLAIDNAARTVQRNPSGWVDPKHYLSQFHIKYNPKLDPNTWTTNFLNIQNWVQNPDNPVLTGWRVKSFSEGQTLVMERNPYYWAIDRWGNQLPYMDGIINTNVQDPQAMRLEIQGGKADFVPGFLVGLDLSDVSTVKGASQQNNLAIDFWDSGSGTASIYFFNQDYQDEGMRNLFRNKVFRQAMSYAYNRARARKVIYYDQGEITSGTEGPKIVEFQIGQGLQLYKQWRDAFSEYNPAKAKQMLDSIGVKVGAGGMRTMPDGSPLQITLDYPADSPQEHITKNQLLAADWKAIGVDATPNPVTPTAFPIMWAAGQAQTTTAWEVSLAGTLLVVPNWEVPIDNARWAPLQGQWFLMQGTAQADQQQNVDPWHRTPPNIAPDPGSPVEALQALYRKAPLYKDFMQRAQTVWEMFKIHIAEGPFYSGTVANYPSLILRKQDMRNVPERTDLALHGATNTWSYPTPAVYDPETFYWSDPSSHPMS